MGVLFKYYLSTTFDNLGEVNIMLYMIRVLVCCTSAHLIISIVEDHLGILR